MKYKNKLIKTFIYFIPHNLLRFLFKIFFNSQFSEIERLKTLEIKGSDQYSLKGFVENKCIFIHIPKAGGVSLSMSLFGNLGFGHSEIYKYLAVFNKRDFNEYFKFTMVRNPWDRLVSAYFFLKSGGYNTTDEEWFNNNISKYENFNQFVTEWVNTKNIYNGIHFIPQHEFLMIKNKLAVDKIYKIENIGEAVVHLNKVLNRKVSIIHKNKTKTKSKTKSYEEYYDKNTKEIVAKVYKKDIELFNYQF